MADTVKGAIRRSWTATFVLLVILSVIGDESFVNSIPTEFYLQLSIAVMLGVFAVSFFIMNRPSGDNDEVAGA